MKRIALLASIVVLLFSSCSNILGNSSSDAASDSAQIRFRNSTIDYQFSYGMKVGDAEHVGPLNIDQTTIYLRSKPGSYLLQAMTSNGSWIDLSQGVLTIEKNRKYTVVISGSSYLDTMRWDLIQD